MLTNPAASKLVDLIDQAVKEVTVVGYDDSGAVKVFYG